MRNVTLVRAAAMIVGFLLVRVVDGLLPWTLPVGAPEWVLVGVAALKYGSGTWMTHSVLRRFLKTVSGPPK